MKQSVFACPRASPCASDQKSLAQIGDAIACTGPPFLTPSLENAGANIGSGI